MEHPRRFYAWQIPSLNMFLLVSCIHRTEGWFSRQDCRKASQTIHISAIVQPFIASQDALVSVQRVKQICLTK